MCAAEAHAEVDPRGGIGAVRKVPRAWPGQRSSIPKRAAAQRCAWTGIEPAVLVAWSELRRASSQEVVRRDAMDGTQCTPVSCVPHGWGWDDASGRQTRYGSPTGRSVFLGCRQPSLPETGPINQPHQRNALGCPRALLHRAHKTKHLRWRMARCVRPGTAPPQGRQPAGFSRRQEPPDHWHWEVRCQPGGRSEAPARPLASNLLRRRRIRRERSCPCRSS